MGLPGWPRARCHHVPQLFRALREHSRVQVFHTKQKGPFPRKTGCWRRVTQPCCPRWACHCQGQHQKEILTTNYLYPRKDQKKKSSLFHSPEPEHRPGVWMFCALQKVCINVMRYTGLCRSWLLWEWAAGLESLAWSPWSGKSTAPRGLPEGEDLGSAIPTLELLPQQIPAAVRA